MNWMKYRFIYFALSSIVIVAGMISLFKWGLNLGVDFKGGSVLEYRFEKQISVAELSKKIEDGGIKVNSLRVSENGSYLIKLSVINIDEKSNVEKIARDLGAGKIDTLRFEMVGPSIGPDLVKKTIVALVISAILILFWITFQFKSAKYGISAVLAMFHDSLVLLGIYSIFGHFFGAEVDFLFVTAMLTILSFSVHDTIVVYDRIRDFQKKSGGNIYDMANHALSETMVRSLNNSFTILFMLIALLLMGGDTVKWFAAALLVGTVSGTYSSPFVAVPILVTWEEIQKKLMEARRK